MNEKISLYNCTNHFCWCCRVLTPGFRHGDLTSEKRRSYLGPEGIAVSRDDLQFLFSAIEMRRSPSRCPRLRPHRSSQNPVFVGHPVQRICRQYAKSANPYTSTIALPKTDYELWPKHDSIRSRYLNKCVDECYRWQVRLSNPNLVLCTPRRSFNSSRRSAVCERGFAPWYVLGRN
jgi:hypothetical protein